ncbi:LysE family transporter, partial [Vibrio sp. 10N.261.55.A7]|uniref:LysE family translocator n=1 Tax=Vibrio sp. 10N.261.55.A7 TaxID=1880851 RepID=UPI0012FFFF6F
VNGSKVVMVSALGNIIGLMFLSILSMGGLSAILLASSTLFAVVKIVGSFYLMYLGFRQIFSSNKNSKEQLEIISNRTLSSYFREG